MRDNKNNPGRRSPDAGKERQTRDLQNDQQNQGSPVKDPADWKTGGEPVTPSQRSYIETMASEAKRTVDFDGLTKAEASQVIDDLQEITGRSGGYDHQQDREHRR